MDLPRHPGRLSTISVLTLLVALTGACGTETPGIPAASETGTPTGSPSPSATATTAADALTTAGLETGPAPKIGYAVNGTLVLPDGGGFRLPKDTLDFARLGDLTVVLQPGPSDSMPVTVLDADGHAVKHDDAVGGGLAVNAEGDVISWMGFDDEPRVLDRGGSRIVGMPTVHGGRSVVDVLGQLDCQEEGAGDIGGCTVLVNADDGHAYVSTSHGFSDLAGPTIWAVGFAAGAHGGVAGVVSQTDDGSCSGLWREGTEPDWRTCDWRFHSVGPDGVSILAGPAYADGLGDGSIAFLGGDGAVLQAWSGGGATLVSRPVWEDAQHALAVVFEDEAWSVVRFGDDGSMEYAVPPQAGTDFDNPFLLQTT